MHANEGSAMPAYQEVKLELPWPPAILNPNNRAHWHPKGNATRQYRAYCKAIASKFPASKKFTITFLPPDNRKRDRDNLIASFKSGQDGLADAWKMDDNQFEVTYAPIGFPVKHGKVVITLSQDTKHTAKGEVP